MPYSSVVSLAYLRLGCLSISRSYLLAFGFSLGMAALGGGVFNFCVDLAAHQESQASHVKPDHQNDQPAVPL